MLAASSLRSTPEIAIPLGPKGRHQILLSVTFSLVGLGPWCRRR